MRTFAQKQNQPQERASSNLAPSNRATSGPHRVDPILHSQRATGNQALQRMLQTDAEELEARLTGTPSPRFGHDFSRISLHPPAAGAIQTKLEINQPGDEYEREADHVAGQVMRISEPQLQRACPCGGGCPKCKTEHPGHEHGRLQTKRVASSELGQAAAPPVVHEALNSPGRPLDANTRAFMEPRFGHDFSQVRVHADEKAAESAGTVGALAYTVGRDVVFGVGHYAPETREGRRLLSHELAHVVQQARSPRPTNMIPAGAMTATDDSLEREAQGAAARIDASQNVFVSSGHPAPGLQRQVGPAVDCSGWENDPESFSKRVADHFVRTEIDLLIPPSARSIECINPRNCEVTYSEELKIAVRWNSAYKRVAADWDHGKKVCLYEYTCDDQGQLILKVLECRQRQQV